MYIHVSSNASHGQILHEVYYDPAGYGSITSTFKEAFDTDETITLIDVQRVFKSNLETTKQVKGSNSFVALYPYYEYQLDLMFFTVLKSKASAQGIMY